MVRLFKRGVECLLIALIVCTFAATLAYSQEAETIEDAFRDGKISGTIGSYFEFVNRDADNADDGWATAYLTLKYETLTWKNLKMGARFFAHGELYSDDEDGTTDSFDNDIESQYTLPELYLNYMVTDKTGVTAGRFNHKKISHIDDAQSEGAFIQVKEIDGLDLTAGVIRSFAEIDYDDGEDFGRTNDAQLLDSENTFGPGSGEVLYFLEGTFSGIDMVTLNPYFMFHNDYASVYGIDTVVETKIEDPEMTVGLKTNYYHVNAEIAGSSDANNYVVSPFVKIKPVDITVGFAQFSDGDALTRPAWLTDYFYPVDQLVTYGTPGSEAFFGKVKLTLGDFWTHFALLDTDYDMTAGRGDGSQEYELQFGYKFTKSLDLNVRLFDVQYDNVDDRDYQKIESRIRFKF